MNINLFKRLLEGSGAPWWVLRELAVAGMTGGARHLKGTGGPAVGVLGENLTSP